MKNKARFPGDELPPTVTAWVLRPSLSATAAPLENAVVAEQPDHPSLLEKRFGEENVTEIGQYSRKAAMEERHMLTRINHVPQMGKRVNLRLLPTQQSALFINIGKH